MVCIKDVPNYLHDSTLYRSFNESDEGSFEIPESCFKPDTTVRSTKDLFDLMNTVRFWGISKLPMEICEFVMDSVEADAVEIHIILANFYELAEYPRMYFELRVVPQNERIQHALSHQSCDVEALQYLHDLGCQVNGEAACAAAAAGNLVCLKWIHEHTDNYVERLPVVAASKGHLRILQYLHAIEFAWSSEVCAAAAEGGHLDCLQYAHENGCSWNDLTLKNAAVNGHLACLTYAFEHGCDSWGIEISDTSAYIAANGHLECLQYAHEHGLRWHQQTVNSALACEQFACMMYAIRNGAESTDVKLFVLYNVGFFILSGYLIATKDSRMQVIAPGLLFVLIPLISQINVIYDWEYSRLVSGLLLIAIAVTTYFFGFAA